MSWSFVNPLSRRPKAGYPDAVARLVDYVHERR